MLYSMLVVRIVVIQGHNRSIMSDDDENYNNYYYNRAVPRPRRRRFFGPRGSTGWSGIFNLVVFVRSRCGRLLWVCSLQLGRLSRTGRLRSRTTTTIALTWQKSNPQSCLPFSEQPLEIIMRNFAHVQPVYTCIQYAMQHIWFPV